MNQVVSFETGEITHFEPQAALVRDAQADAVIDLGKRIQDWDAVDRAVEAKLDNQEDLVSWWKENVRGPGKRANIPDRGYFVEKAEELTGITSKQVSRWAKRLEDRAGYRASIVGVAYRKAMQAAHNHGALGTGENEWYTPEKYIIAARSVMGTIDLDPASSNTAQEIIQAEKFFTAEQDGLKQEWHGCVWMNPPYAQPLIHHFIEKLIAEATSGRVEQAIVLTHNSTDTLWFHRLEELAAALCFTKGRIAFIDPQGDRAAPTQGQTFFYIGEERDRFSEVFTEFGFIR